MACFYFSNEVLVGARIRSQVDQAARRELNSIGVNLNQLAYHANATGRLQQLRELRSVLAAILSNVDEL